MRTTEYRYTEWCEWDGPALRPRWSKVVGRELYDHRKDNGTQLDMDLWEVVNMAVLQEHAGLVAKLSKQLHAEVEKWWTPNLPPTPAV